MARKPDINRIIQGDCLEVMKDWPDNCVDLVVTSPPYDRLRDYDGYKFNFEGIAAQLFRIVSNGAVCVWIVGDESIDQDETGSSFRQALFFKQIGFKLLDTMIYAKTGFNNPDMIRYHQVFEYMFVFTKGYRKTFNPIEDKKNKNKRMGGYAVRQRDGSMKKRQSYVEYETYGRRYNIWTYNTGLGHCSSNNIAHEHPAIFPEQLAIDHIKSWSNKDDLILDPLCGSGTTCVAAKMLGRNYIGIDISEKYCEIARMRLEAVDTGVPIKERLAGQMPLFKE